MQYLICGENCQMLRINLSRPHVPQVSKESAQCRKAHSTVKGVADLNVTASPLKFKGQQCFCSSASCLSFVRRSAPFLSLSSPRFSLQFDVLGEQAGSVPSSLATSFRPVCQVTTTSATTRPTVNHHQERKNLIGVQNFKKSQTSRCSQTTKSSILDYHHPHPSRGHGSQGCHHKKGHHWRVPVRDR